MVIHSIFWMRLWKTALLIVAIFIYEKLDFKAKIRDKENQCILIRRKIPQEYKIAYAPNVSNIISYHKQYGHITEDKPM